jgi:hypothetical protein
MDNELKQHLEAMESRITRDTRTLLDTRLETMESRLTEAMRDMQTELLRGFAAFSQGQTIRLRKVEADQSNLDAALSGRVNVLEGRLLEIELRLGLAGENDRRNPPGKQPS